MSSGPPVLNDIVPCETTYLMLLVTNLGEVILINAVFISFYVGVTIYVIILMY